METPSRKAIEKWAPTLYFVVGQIGWFACVIGGAKNLSWIGVVVVVVLVLAHVARVARPREELKLIVCVLLIGGMWDSALVYFGLLEYHSGEWVAGFAPVWIVALWALFAAQFNTTYRWLKTRILVAALLGAVAGPLSFRGGAALHALRFAKPWPAVVALVLGWGVLLPLVVLLSRRFDGVNIGPQPT